MPDSPESPLLATLRERIVVADGAMGSSMRQDAELALDHFSGLEGGNEILDITRPDVVRGIHDAYFAVGGDAVETNTFGRQLQQLLRFERIGVHLTEEFLLDPEQSTSTIVRHHPEAKHFAT